MNSQVIEVRLFNQKMGTLFYFDNKLCFQFTPEFIKSGLDPSPYILKPMSDVIVCKALQYNKGLPGTLADSLPDKFGSDVFSTYLKLHTINPNSLQNLDYLSYVGERGMGALSYLPSKSMPVKGDFHLDTLFNYAQLRMEEQQQFSLDLANKEDGAKLQEVSGYVGGARPKAVIYRKGKHIISGLVPNPPKDYKAEIIKITMPVRKESGKTEHIYQKIAQKIGITTMGTELLESHGCTHFIIERFDRVGGRKLHTQTYAGLHDIELNNRPIAIEAVMSTIGKLTSDKSQIHEMFTRMLFNIVAGNRDDHCKNTSFIMDEKGKWKLAPAYDITYEYHTNSPWYANHHTGLNGKQNNFLMSDIEKVAEEFEIENPKMLVEKVTTLFNEEFPKLANDFEMAKEKISEIVTQTQAFQKSLHFPKIMGKPVKKATDKSRGKKL